MGKLTKEAYVRMCDENMEWLKNQPDCLEKMHIEMIVADSPERYYDDKRLIASLESELERTKRFSKKQGRQLELCAKGELKDREWISCEDRLPDDLDLVIVRGGVGYYCYGEDRWFTKLEQDINGDDRPIQWKVTHWQPLPEDPK